MGLYLGGRGECEGVGGGGDGDMFSGLWEMFGGVVVGVFYLSVGLMVGMCPRICVNSSFVGLCLKLIYVHDLVGGILYFSDRIVG